jgi:flagellar capping protein FliD
VSIKKLVNEVETYNSYLEELKALVEKEQKTLEQAVDPVVLYKAQGSLATLRKLQTLREIVNGRDRKTN